jgi:WD40 repeat protein
MRRSSTPIHTLTGHQSDIYSIQWAPFSQDIIASAAADKRIYIWDMNRIGESQNEEEKEDGPPELLFIHGGHTDRVRNSIISFLFIHYQSYHIFSFGIQQRTMPMHICTCVVFLILYALCHVVLCFHSGV